jgi:hypothetical protein
MKSSQFPVYPLQKLHDWLIRIIRYGIGYEIGAELKPETIKCCSISFITSWMILNSQYIADILI